MAQTFYVAREVHPSSRLDPRRSCARTIRIRPHIIIIAVLIFLLGAVG